MKLILLILLLPLTAFADKLPPAALAVRSTGTPDGNSLVLTTNGFAGTYLRVDQPSHVLIGLKANLAVEIPANPDVALRHSIVPHDPLIPLTVAVGSHRHTLHFKPNVPEALSVEFDLPPGTHLLRLEFASAPPLGKATLTLIDLTITGADILNQHTDELALAAADTFIETGRRTVVTLQLPQSDPAVTIRQLTHDFAFGANVSGADARLVNPDAPPGSPAALFQQFFPRHFNAAVPSNMGKWAYNEPAPGSPTMQDIDAVLSFATKHGMRTRMHALMWDTAQQPQWVLDLLTAADSGDTAAKEQLRQAIRHRIDYYVRQRASRYHELDVLNESLHEARYLKVFGPDELAEFFRLTAAAVRDANATTTLYLNEYNVMQNSRRPPYGRGTPPGADDLYANWYREHAEDLISRGAPVTGIGVQYYAGPDTRPPHQHSPARIAGVFHNLGSAGLAVTLTEFGISRRSPIPQGDGQPTTRPLADPETARQLLDESLRLAFGNPCVNGFYFFGFWQNAMWNQAPSAVLADESFNLTPLGQHYVKLREQWTTKLTAPTDASGKITFPAFHGSYELTTSAGQRLTFTVTPQTRTITPR